MTAAAWLAQSLATLACVLALLLAIRECGLRIRLVAHPVTVLTVVLWYVTAGPWLQRLLLGEYRRNILPWATVGYAAPTYVHILVLVSFVAGYVAVRLKLGEPQPRDRREVVVWRHAPLALHILALVGLIPLIGEYILLYRLWGAGTKMEIIHAVGHPIRTMSIAFVIIGLSLGIAANVYVHRKLATGLTLTLLVAYGLYGLAASERDIVIVLAALLVAFAKLSRPPGRTLLAGAGVLAFLFFVPVLVRSGGLAFSSQVETLREKSRDEKLRKLLETNNTLRMTGFVLHYAPTSREQLHGETFMSTVLSLVPSITGLRQKRFRNATEWFLPHIPNQNIGFRMSMPGEGYLNFGYPGVVMLYFPLGVLAGLLFSRRGGWRRLEGVYPLYIAIVVACVNWDSTMVLKLTVYGLILWALMSRTRPQRATEPAAATSAATPPDEGPAGNDAPRPTHRPNAGGFSEPPHDGQRQLQESRWGAGGN